MPLYKLTKDQAAKVARVLAGQKAGHIQSLAKLFEAPAKGTVTIRIEGGVLDEVENLPEGWDYRVQDSNTMIKCMIECVECGTLFDSEVEGDGELCPDCAANQEETA